MSPFPTYYAAFFLTAATFSIVNAFHPQVAYSAELEWTGVPHGQLKILESKNGEENEKVEWRTDSPEVLLNSAGNGDELVARVDGCIGRSQVSIVLGQEVLKGEGKDGRCFNALLPVTGSETTFVLKFVAQDGSTTQAGGIVLVDDPQRIKLMLQHKPKRLRITGMALGALSSYSETSVTPITAYKVVPSLNVAFDLVRLKWDLQAAGTMDALALWPRPVEKWTRFLRLDLTGGYRFQRKFWGVELQLRAGPKYVSMFVSDSTFGFYNATAFQFYPVISRRLNESHRVDLILGYSPVLSGFGLMSIDSRSINVDVQWEVSKWSERWPVLFSAQYENFQLRISQSTLTHQAVFVGVGTRWSGL